MKLTKLFIEFFESKKASGFVLLFCTLLSLLISNCDFGNYYVDFWNFKLSLDIGSFHLAHSIEAWINEGLMTIFFLLVGLEIEREIYIGELYPIKKAFLPILVALGGMIMPAILYVIINWGLESQVGFGIPMATDIAFAIAILSILDKKIPNSLKVLLTAIAIIDDLGSILVIALFYGNNIEWFYLLTALGIGAILISFNYLKVRALSVYLIMGSFMWLFMLHSGIHASITGVFLAFAIPFEDGSSKSPSYRLQHYLDKPVSFVILPIFTLANTAILITLGSVFHLFDYYTVGILIGLLIGKPLGITIVTWFMVKFKMAKMPKGVTFYHIIGMGFLAGMGFTMSIFITLLAFEDAQMIQNAKLTILISSTLAGVIGFVILNNFQRIRYSFQRKGKILTIAKQQ